MIGIGSDVEIRVLYLGQVLRQRSVVKHALYYLQTVIHHPTVVRDPESVLATSTHFIG